MVQKRAKTEDESRSVLGLWTALLVSVGRYFDETRAKVSRAIRDKRIFDTKNFKKRLLEDEKLLAALARGKERQEGDFNMQNFLNTTCTFFSF